MKASPLAPVLIVDDNAEDFTALNRAFRKNEVRHPVVRCEDGDQALEYLQGYGRHPAWPKMLPSIILLDLNMPGTDGQAVLNVLKHDTLLRTIPVIVFTTSANSRDVAECYRLGANSYLTKPIEYHMLEEKIGLIARYWLDSSELYPVS